MKNTSSAGCLETRPQLRSFQTWTAQSAKSVLGKIAFNIYAGGTLIPQTSFAADGSISPFWESSFLHSGVDLIAGHPVNVDVYYNGKTLTVIETDTAIGKTARQDYTVNLNTFIGASQAYAGFTRACGALTSVQNIIA
jgi:hypothetical protein